MALPDLLPIVPFGGAVSGEVVVPGSKSLTNRAMMLAALAEGRTTLTGALFSEDTEIMGEALRRLGFRVEMDAGSRTISVEGLGGRIPAEEAEIFVGLAGTAARFLTALCAAAPRGRYRLDGTLQMRKRPMKGLIDALRALGAEIACEGAEGFFPFLVQARGLGIKGGEGAASTVSIDARESSQMLSALLMVAPLAGASGGASGSPKELRIQLAAAVREPFVEMTVRLMEQFGVRARHEAGGYAIAAQRYRSPGDHFPIEPDATAAGYFLALPLAASGSLKIRGLVGGSEASAGNSSRPQRAMSQAAPSAERAGRSAAARTSDSLQGDIVFLNVLRKFGLRTEAVENGVVASYPQKGRAWSPPITPATAGSVWQVDFREFSDTFLTLAALSPLLSGPVRIVGIAHTRKQETDRVDAMATELRKLLGAGKVQTAEDSLEVHPLTVAELRRQITRPVEVETYGDHRVAMSFGILGAHDLFGDGRAWISIRHPGVCAKTFPNFFEVLESVRPRLAPTAGRR